MAAGKRIVLTADRSLMTNYRGNFLYGFIACGPYELVPEFVFDKLFCPSVETDKNTGEVKVAQCGLRRVEGALLKEYQRDEIFHSSPRNAGQISRTKHQSLGYKRDGSTGHGTCYHYYVP